MSSQTGLLGADEVGRQQQDAVGARSLGRLGEFDGQRRPLPGGGDDRVRPRFSSMQARTTRSISAGVSEKNSPVPPAANRPETL